MPDTDPKQYVAGSSSLVLGVDSYTSPAELADQEFVSGQNVVCRGGIVQTRPGSRSMYCMPSGNLQGFKVFTPDNGVAHHVFVVDGKVYVSAAPFTSYRRLWNLQFSVTSKYISWTVCLKSTDFDNEGNLYSLDNPYSVLVMQDGLTRAAYWDGGNSGHLNPGDPPYPNQNSVLPGYNETPIGLWSAWSGNRLWVSRENQVFASDIGNPLKFTEDLYLNEARAFQLSGPCTGMIVTPDQQGIIVFTETNGTFFQSTIENRPTWLDTPDFQKVIIPNVGCVAPRSLVTQYGLTWWFGPRGLTNVDAALRLNVTSRIDYKDNEMFSSKAYLGPDLSGVAATFYENYLMVSVPSGDVLNRHTWVLDQAPFDGNANAWVGIWTGWRPVEWGRGIVNGSERVFFASVDYDGRNRAWEAMLPERADNGCAITCYAQLRDHAGGDLNQKRYDWSKFFLSQIYGDVDLNIYVASTKGGYQLQKNYHLVASEGQVFGDIKYSEAGPFLMGNRVQSRTIRTPSGLGDNECNTCGVESKEGNLIDYAFSHLLVWSGQMGIRAYQIHMYGDDDRAAGDCEEAEVGPRTLNAQGCSGLELLVQGEVFKEFEATVEGSTVTREGGSVYIRQTATSVISQENAQVLAECRVQQIINQLVGRSPAVGVYNSDSAEMGTNTSFVVVEGKVSPLPPPTPVLDVSFISECGDASLCGYSEFVSPSVPPKKYRLKTYSGIFNSAFRQASDCTGPVVGCDENTFTGTKSYNLDTCGLSITSNWHYQTSLIQSPQGSCPPYIASNNYSCPDAWSGDPTLSVSYTPTTSSWIPNGNCHDIGGGNYQSSSGPGAVQALSVEDTEDDAIARATPSGSGTSAQSFRETRGAGDFVFSWQDATLDGMASNLVNGADYNITIDLLTEDYGGGSPVSSQLVYLFSATGETQSINIPIPCASGKQVTASNPIISYA